ncbi:hypothetical protein Trydic_g12944 [Trypoxylus dichotomus]
MTATDSYREEIAASTTDQFKSDDRWLTERKVRLTSSFFGHICKSRESSRTRIVHAIRNSRTLHTTSLSHGRKYESTARDEYCSKYDRQHRVAADSSSERRPELPGSAGKPQIQPTRSSREARVRSRERRTLQIDHPIGEIGESRKAVRENHRIVKTVSYTSSLSTPSQVQAIDLSNTIPMQEKHLYYQS